LHALLGIEIPVLRIPLSIGRNAAILVEVAARNHVLKRMGVHAARAFTATLGAGPGTPDPSVDPCGGDEPA
jgi:HPr kinase/phosphorylase